MKRVTLFQNGTTPIVEEIVHAEGFTDYVEITGAQLSGDQAVSMANAILRRFDPYTPAAPGPVLPEPFFQRGEAPPVGLPEFRSGIESLTGHMDYTEVDEVLLDYLCNEPWINDIERGRLFAQMLVKLHVSTPHLRRYLGQLRFQMQRTRA